MRAGVTVSEVSHILYRFRGASRLIAISSKRSRDDMAGFQVAARRSHGQQNKEFINGIYGYHKFPKCGLFLIRLFIDRFQPDAKKIFSRKAGRLFYCFRLDGSSTAAF